MNARNYARFPGPGDLPGDSSHPNSPDYDDSRDEAVDELVDEYRDDPAKLAAAEESVAGTFDGSHYSEVTLALHALHRTDPDKLLGSDVLATLYRLARIDHDAIESALREMAESAIDRRWAA